MKKNIVYLCSFPKSGRTWVRFILANYFNLYYQLELNIDFVSMFQVIPNNSLHPSKGINNYLLNKNSKIPLILADHKLCQTQHRNHPVIFILRSPYDVIVSYYFHLKFQASFQIGSISQFLQHKEHGITHLISYINHWSNQLSQLDYLIVSYEKLHININMEIKKILEFSNVGFSSTILDISIKQSEFKKMKNIEKKTRFPYDNPLENTESDNSFRIREGKVNNAQKHLSATDIEFIYSELETQLSTQSFELYQSNGIDLTCFKKA